MAIILCLLVVAFAVAAVLINEGEHAVRRARRRRPERDQRVFGGTTAAR